jgi:hypothetical protein
LPSASETLTVTERQRIVRLLLEDVLVGEDTITIRHSIPIPSGPPQNGGSLARRPKLPFVYGAWLAQFWRTFFSTRVRSLDGSDTPGPPMVSYADNGAVHCCNEQQAQALKSERQARLAECRLEMHPTKTKIVYCEDKKRKGTYPNVKFDFLGYCFRPRLVRRFRDNTLFCGFNPAVSSSAMKAMRSAIRDLNLRHQTQLSLEEIARRFNPLLRGWIAYYGRYAPSALGPLLRYVNQTLVAWAMRKFKRFKDHKLRASQFLHRLAVARKALFVHWAIGMTGTFA